MKNSFLLLRMLLPVVALLTFSCENEEETAPVINPEESQKIESSETLSYIKDLGFDEELIEDQGEYYVVDGDMLFYKEMHVHPKKPKQGRSTQYSSGQLVAPDRQQNISIRVDPSLSNWQTAVQNAINSFNSLADCRLRFNITTSSDADINIIPSFATAVADAVFPANGREGFRIRINTAYTGANTDARRQLIIAHELGHCVGLRHSDWYNRGGSGQSEPQNTYDPNTGAPITAELIPGTPQSDANSVMNCCIAGNSWGGFSGFDVVALNELYPANNTTGWEKLPGLGIDIAIGADGSAFVLGVNPEPGGNGVYRWNGSTWTKYGGAGLSLAVAPSGLPWITNSDNYIYRKISGQTSWEKLSGLGIDIAIGANSSVFILGVNPEPGGNGVYRWNGSSWTKYGGAGLSIAVAPSGLPWITNSDNYIYRKISGQTSWEKLPGLGIDIAIGADGSAFVIGINNGVYKWNGSKWVRITQIEGVKIAVDPSGTPWILDSDNNIYRYNG